MPTWRLLIVGLAALVVAGLLAVRSRGRGDADFVRPTGHPSSRDGTALHVEPHLVPFNDQPWHDLKGNGWSYLRRASSREDDIAADSTAPFSPPDVLRIAFTPDMPRDHEPSVHWISLPTVREVYALWWIKLSTNWTSSPAGGGKMTFLHATPNGQGQVYSGLFGATAPHHVSVNTEWAPYGQRIWDPNITATPVDYGRWYRIEWYVKWESTRGAGDGIMRWWLNGILNGDHRDVRFPTASDGFHQFEFAPTLQEPPAQEQYMYVDHTYIGIR
jgi:hypothetical protein